MGENGENKVPVGVVHATVKYGQAPINIRGSTPHRYIWRIEPLLLLLFLFLFILQRTTEKSCENPSNHPSVLILPSMLKFWRGFNHYIAELCNGGQYIVRVRIERRSTGGAWCTLPSNNFATRT
jgi:hypothetical protein